MAQDSIDRVRQSIKERLEELDGERDALMRALDALNAGGGTTGQRMRRAAAARTATGNGRRKSGGKRAPRGQRREQVLQALAGGELGPSAIAREIGVNPTQISSLLRQLASEGRVARTEGGKWALSGGGTASPAASDAASVEPGAPAGDAAQGEA